LNMVGILWSRVSGSKDHVKFCRTCVIIFKIRIIAYLETWSYMIQALLIFSFLDEDCRSKRMWRADLFWVDSSAGFGLWGSTGLFVEIWKLKCQDFNYLVYLSTIKLNPVWNPPPPIPQIGLGLPMDFLHLFLKS